MTVGSTTNTLFDAPVDGNVTENPVTKCLWKTRLVLRVGGWFCSFSCSYFPTYCEEFGFYHLYCTYCVRALVVNGIMGVKFTRYYNPAPKGHFVRRRMSNLPTQSNSQPVRQHFNPVGQCESSPQTFSTSSGHSAGVSNVGHVPGGGQAKHGILHDWEKSIQISSSWWKIKWPC